MKRIVSLAGLSIALMLLVAACGSEALSRPDADATIAASNSIVGELTTVPELHLEDATEEITEEAAEVETEEATEEVTAEATVELTDEATAEVTLEITEIETEEATEEVTAEATVELTDEATAEATVAVTLELTVEASEEATGEAQMIPTVSSPIPSEEDIAASVEAANVARGEELFTVAAQPSCTVCHATDGITLGGIGPNLGGLSEHAGTRVAGQEPYTYVYNSIRNPHDFTVEGFPPNVMFNYTNVLTEQDIYDLIAYLWTLE